MLKSEPRPSGSGSGPNWLESQLSRHLGAVSAPGNLWDRIQSQSAPPRIPERSWLRWPIAAIVALLVLWLPGKWLHPEFHPTVLAARADEWTLQCAPPAAAAIYQVAAVPGHKAQVVNCYQCHAAILN